MPYELNKKKKKNQLSAHLLHCPWASMHTHVRKEYKQDFCLVFYVKVQDGCIIPDNVIMSLSMRLSSLCQRLCDPASKSAQF